MTRTPQSRPRAPRRRSLLAGAVAALALAAGAQGPRSSSRMAVRVRFSSITENGKPARVPLRLSRNS